MQSQLDDGLAEERMSSALSNWLESYSLRAAPHPVTIIHLLRTEPELVRYNGGNFVGYTTVCIVRKLVDLPIAYTPGARAIGTSGPQSLKFTTAPSTTLLSHLVQCQLCLSIRKTAVRWKAHRKRPTSLAGRSPRPQVCPSDL